MRIPILPVLLAAALIGCFSDREATAPAGGDACAFTPGEDVPGSTLIVVARFTFQPAEVRVRPGDRVTWVNCGEEAVPHTSTADGGEWASPLLEVGESFTHTFGTPGQFPYHCEPHPFMVGRVIVE